MENLVSNKLGVHLSDNAYLAFNLCYLKLRHINNTISKSSLFDGLVINSSLGKKFYINDSDNISYEICEIFEQGIKLVEDAFSKYIECYSCIELSKQEDIESFIKSVLSYFFSEITKPTDIKILSDILYRTQCTVGVNTLVDLSDVINNAYLFHLSSFNIDNITK